MVFKVTLLTCEYIYTKMKIGIYRLGIKALCTTPNPWVLMMVLFGVRTMDPSSYNTLYGVLCNFLMM